MTLAPERTFLAALRGVAAADSGVRAILGDPARLYDDHPVAAEFPFATIGRIETANADSAGSAALAHTLTLHVWSRYGGKAEALDALGALRDALHHAALDIEDRRLVLLSAIYSDVFLADDGRTHHGVLRMRAMVEAE